MKYKSKSLKFTKYSRNLKLCLWTFALSLIFCNSVKADSVSISYKTNIFYTKVLNYTLPLIKVTSVSSKDEVESQFILKESVLKFLGICKAKPLSIIEKEVSYLKKVELENIEGRVEDYSLNPFKLEDNSIDKLSMQPRKIQKETPDESIPNKEVIIYNPNLTKSNNNAAKPQIFIYHSHATEGYGIGSTDDTTDINKNVVAVGAALKKELESKYGVSVVHDTTVHNVPDYNGAYGKSAKTIEKYLKSYGDFKLIIDMHRDSTPTRTPVITKLNGEIVARYMFVMCKKNPHFDKNMLAVNKLLNISEELFPGLARDSKDGKGIYYVNYGIDFYNQAKSNNSVLIEMGSNLNTIDETKGTVKYLARVIAEYISGKN